jgi:hypothetical protein
MSFLSGRNGSEKRLNLQADTDLWGVDHYQPTSTAMEDSVARRQISSGSSPRGNQNKNDGRKIVCGNPECTASWGKPWKSRQRPIFEGQWGCGPRCLQALIRGAVRREAGDGIVGMGETPHRHRVPLGLMMLAKGWITQPQLRRALECQKVSGGKIGEWLQEECGLTSATVTRGLSMQWNCPVLTTDGFEPQGMALVMPRLFVQELNLTPLRIAASRLLYLAFEDRLDASAAFSLQQMTDLKVESGLVEGEPLLQVRERLLRAEFVPATQESMKDSEQMIMRVGEVLEERQPIAARLVRVQRYYWLRTWLEVGTQGAAGTVPVSTEDVMDTIFRVGS